LPQDHVEISAAAADISGSFFMSLSSPQDAALHEPMNDDNRSGAGWKTSSFSRRLIGTKCLVVAWQRIIRPAPADGAIRRRCR